MKIKKFDVVELKDNNRATILDVNNNCYLAERVNANGVTIDKIYITDEEIKKIIYTKSYDKKINRKACFSR